MRQNWCEQIGERKKSVCEIEREKWRVLDKWFTRYDDSMSRFMLVKDK